MPSLVGSEMCIRDSGKPVWHLDQRLFVFLRYLHSVSWKFGSHVASFVCAAGSSHCASTSCSVRKRNSSEATYRAQGNTHVHSERQCLTNFQNLQDNRAAKPETTMQQKRKKIQMKSKGCTHTHTHTTHTFASTSGKAENMLKRTVDPRDDKHATEGRRKISAARLGGRAAPCSTQLAREQLAQEQAAQKRS